ncbi:MAG: T9SS type A sorting domain-containing protein [Candidatus Cloacimonetes bacterium]|nr:T9SS type A sorting domain-containing protein [Candidatus Cloacimonadota bacterium]
MLSTSLWSQNAVAPATGSGTQADPYQIENLDNLFWIAAPDSIVPDPNSATRWSSHYIQTANIDASPTQTWFPDGTGNYYGWLPIVQFSGSYDGNVHTISDLYLNRPNSFIGLFGITSSTSFIANLALTEVDITCSNGSSMCTGAFVGQCFGQIDNCFASGIINGKGCTGGLVGELWIDGIITNSYTEGTISGNAGGLVGLNRGTITDSYSTADLMGSSDCKGGFVASNMGTIDNCYATGFVSGGGNGNAGGFVNYNTGTITNSHATGEVIPFGIRSGGGFAAINESTISHCYATGNVTSGVAGGFIAYQHDSGAVENSYAMGNVTNVYSWFPMYAGGFIGINASTCSISNCYSRGNVIRDHLYDSAPIGGFVGKNQQGIITNSFSTGYVAYNGVANPEDKGFAGAVDTTGTYAMSGNYWDMETSFQYSTAGDAEGRFTSNMTSPYATNTYVNWDFADIWAEDINYTFNNGYPYLLQSSVSVDEEIFIQNIAQLKNYPNPFKNVTTISFALPFNAKCSLSIYNLRGQKIRTLLMDRSIDQDQNFSIVWDAKDNSGKDISPGIYFYNLIMNGKTAETKKLILMR